MVSGAVAEVLDVRATAACGAEHVAHAPLQVQVRHRVATGPFAVAIHRGTKEGAGAGGQPGTGAPQVSGGLRWQGRYALL